MFQSNELTQILHLNNCCFCNIVEILNVYSLQYREYFCSGLRRFQKYIPLLAECTINRCIQMFRPYVYVVAGKQFSIACFCCCVFYLQTPLIPSTPKLRYSESRSSEQKPAPLIVFIPYTSSVRDSHQFYLVGLVLKTSDTFFKIQLVQL